MEGMSEHSGGFSEDMSDASSPLNVRRKISELFVQNSTTTKYTPLTPARRFSYGPEWLTIAKLNFEAVRLYGRDEELSIMQRSLEKLSSGTTERHLILISGESGTGKTALADSLRRPTAKRNGFFVRGKFDFNNRHEPYSGIVRACVEVCDKILCLQEKKKIRFQKVSRLLIDGLGSELSLLTRFIPPLKEVADHRDEEANVSLGGSSSEQARSRFQFAFQRFIRIISNEFAPLVLVLDDLQWADKSSLDLLDACLSDLWIKNFMIIGTFRSNEVDQTHILSNAIVRFRYKCQEAVFGMSNLLIENLDVKAVNKIIGALLSMDNDELTMGLAQVCFQKTQGNPFFVLQFLQMVRNSGMLKYNYGYMSWNWNNDEIFSGTTATTNVVDVLKAKMLYLPESQREILKIAAILGSVFDVMCVMIIWEHSYNSVLSSGEGNDRESLETSLASLENEGYIVKHSSQSSQVSPQPLPSSSQSFSWTHDKIHEAATLLIPIEERAALLRDAGYLLLNKLGKGALGSTIFVVANLLNEGEGLVDIYEKRLILASLNHEACLRALSISAFESVADYARKGIKLLPENHWTDHYELSLGLHSVAAQAEGFLGNYDLMEHYCNIVLSQKDRPIVDKTWVYRTLVNSKFTKGQIKEVKDLLFRIMAMCDCHFPTNPVLITAQVIKTALKMKSITKCVRPEALLESSNPILPDFIHLMDRLSFCLYLTKDARYPLVIFQILDWTIKHGHCDFSSVAFGLTGLMLIGVLNDFHAGSWYGEQALILMDKSKSAAARARTKFVVYFFVMSWTKPIPQLVTPMLCAYNEAMLCGDQNSAAYSCFFWLLFRYIAGNPLKKLEKDVRLYSMQLKDWKVMIQSTFASCLHQTILNLVGSQDGNCKELLGEAFSEEDHNRCSRDTHLLPMVNMCQGILLTYFGNHLQRAKTTIQDGPNYLKKSYPASAAIPFDTLLTGISCFAAARETGQIKYSKMGEKQRSKIKKWREIGNPNVIHFETFLDAESAALKNKKIDAMRSYEKTINHAGRTGFLQDAAFACERLAEFQLTVMGDEKEAGYRLDQSLKFWRDWGAMGKVEALQEKYRHLFPNLLS